MNENRWFAETYRQTLAQHGFKLTELGTGESSRQLLLQIGTPDTNLPLPEAADFSDGGKIWLETVFGLKNAELDYTGFHGSWLIVSQYF
ncbi:MAG: hypothetical protein Q4D82_03835 [Neisseria sp.]|nr:hypothetical protein [Neisseria sp.]